MEDNPLIYVPLRSAAKNGVALRDAKTEQISVNILHTQKVFFKYNHCLIIFSISSEAVMYMKMQYMLFGMGDEERRTGE